jgi:hypothetical protein
MGKIKMKTIKYLRKVQNYTTSRELPSAQKLDEKLRLYGNCFWFLCVQKLVFRNFGDENNKKPGNCFSKICSFCFFPKKHLVIGFENEK